MTLIVPAAAFDGQMDLTWDERFHWQNRKSLAFSGGTVSLDVAQYLYRAIGEVGSDSNGGWPADLDLADKVVVTLCMAEILRGVAA